MPIAKLEHIDLYYERQGEGDVLLMIMGITARGEVWEDHLAYWCQFFDCIIVDNRGVGMSSVPGGAYTSEVMAQDYIALLDHLDISECYVVGCSMGSIIAQQLALQARNTVRKLVLMCPWAYCDERTKAIFELMVHCKAKFSPDEFMHFVQTLIFSKKSWDQPQKVAKLRQDQKAAVEAPLPQTYEGLYGQAMACIHHNVRDQLPSIHQPTLVIGGSEDAFIPAWMATEMAELIPQADLHLYPKAGHAFHWEEIEDFNPRVAQWLQS